MARKPFFGYFSVTPRYLRNFEVQDVATLNLPRQRVRVGRYFALLMTTNPIPRKALRQSSSRDHRLAKTCYSFECMAESSLQLPETSCNELWVP